MVVSNNTSEFNDMQITYLQMIQSVIDRMSTTSSILKGFAATIVAGVSIISFKDTKLIILIIAFFPIVSFMILDAYYLQIERRYRYLYEEVRTGEKIVDFDLIPPTARLIKSNRKNTGTKQAGYGKCLLSKSITLFYIPIVLVCAIVIFLKVGGMI